MPSKSVKATASIGAKKGTPVKATAAKAGAGAKKGTPRKSSTKGS